MGWGVLRACIVSGPRCLTLYLLISTKSSIPSCFRLLADKSDTCLVPIP